MTIEYTPLCEEMQLSFLPCNTLYYQLPKEMQQRIDNSFDRFFRYHILPLIPEGLVKNIYNPRQMGRPAEYTRNTIASIFYMKLKGINEEFFLQHIHTDARMQYALGLENLSHQTFSSRTFSRLRKRFEEIEEQTSHDLWDEITQSMNDCIAIQMGLHRHFSPVYTAAYRIDSMMIDSHATHMTRIQLFYIAVQLSVSLLVQLGIPDLIPKELVHYLDKKDEHRNTYYKGTYKELREEYEKLGLELQQSLDDDSMKNRTSRLAVIGDLRLHSISKELEIAHNMLKDYELTSTREYRLINRIMDEQLVCAKDGKLVPRDGKEITGSSLQSLYDETMAYRRKNDEKNYGYVGCFAELYDPEGHGCIVWRQFEPNVYSDQLFAENFYNYLIEQHSLSTNNCRIAVSCDALFTSASLQAKVRSTGIDIYCASTGYTPDPILAEFIMDEQYQNVIKCPMGNIPECTFDPEKMGGMITAKFKKGECSDCVHCDSCKATTGKRGISTLKLRTMQVVAAQNIKSLNDPVFHMFVDKRNGVESLPAVLRKKYRIDECPRFGYRNQRMDYYTSITSLNIKKYFQYDRDMRSKK